MMLKLKDSEKVIQISAIPETDEADTPRVFALTNLGRVFVIAWSSIQCKYLTYEVAVWDDE